MAVAKKGAAKKVAAKKQVAAKQAHKKSGAVSKTLRFPAMEFNQSGNKLYVFQAKASQLYDALSINRRVEGKDEGYQRTLSVSRVQAIMRHIKAKRPIPGAIITSFDNATFDAIKGEITVPAGTDVGWVIDGQHRLAGAAMAAREGVDIDLPVVAFIDLSQDRQIEEFIVINREAKNVPTSLYLDLLGKISNRRPGDLAKERAADLGTQLRRDEDTPFFERIVVTVSPKDGQISLVNFVRKISPLVTPDKGMLHIYTESEQRAVISNLFKALREVFPKEYNSKGNIFFKTVGFGGLWNAFPTIFSLTLKYHQGFEVKDVIEVLKKISDFDFGGWKEYGTGSSAEITAGEDLKTSLHLAFNSLGPTGTLRV